MYSYRTNTFTKQKTAIYQTCLTRELTSFCNLFLHTVVYSATGLLPPTVHLIHTALLFFTHTHERDHKKTRIYTQKQVFPSRRKPTCWMISWSLPSLVKWSSRVLDNKGLLILPLWNLGRQDGYDHLHVVQYSPSQKFLTFYPKILSCFLFLKHARLTWWYELDCGGRRYMVNGVRYR